MKIDDIIQQSEELNKRSTKTVVLTDSNYTQLTKVSEILAKQNKKISLKDLANILLNDSLKNLDINI